VPVRIDHYSKNLIIIDDICDGGRTFLNIAEEIKKAQPERTGKIYLVVSHGIFSAGFDELSKHLDGIYCSNSYSDIENSVVGQLDVF
jgi:ribose-phosphate pyrophosphokinase